MLTDEEIASPPISIDHLVESATVGEDHFDFHSNFPLVLRFICGRFIWEGDAFVERWGCRPRAE